MTFNWNIVICSPRFLLLFLAAVKCLPCDASVRKEEVLLNIKPVKLIINTGESALLRRRCVNCLKYTKVCRFLCHIDPFG